MGKAYAEDGPLHLSAATNMYRFCVCEHIFEKLLLSRSERMCGRVMNPSRRWMSTNQTWPRRGGFLKSTGWVTRTGIGSIAGYSLHSWHYMLISVMKWLLIRSKNNERWQQKWPWFVYHFMPDSHQSWTWQLIALPSKPQTYLSTSSWLIRDPVPSCDRAALHILR